LTTVQEKNPSANAKAPLALLWVFSYLPRRKGGLDSQPGFPFKARATVIMDAAVWRADHF